MPLYEFRCEACGHQFEAIRKYSDPSEGVECPTCGQLQAKKLLSAPAATRTSSGGSSGGCVPRGGFT